MNKAESLIFLVRSMTKAEKKRFNQDASESDYMILYSLINKDQSMRHEVLKERYEKLKPTSNFNTTCNYLYDLILDTLLALREKRDTEVYLTNLIHKSRILFSKGMYDEALLYLAKVKDKAKEIENEHTLFIASRLELEYLLFMDFPNISEKKLSKKQFKASESLRRIRRTNEQATLYELMKHRILYRDNVRTEKQKEYLNDLVVSEMSIMASSNIETFEIKKLHQMFQSAYLISVGDNKSALRSYVELNKLFEDNPQFWHNPPLYYVMVISGILESLRGIRDYKGMEYFIAKLDSFDSSSADFDLHVLSIKFLYKLFSYLDSGDFKQAKKWIEQNQKILIDKIQLLYLEKQAEITLYLALTDFGLGDHQKAHQKLSSILYQNKSVYMLPLSRTIHLVHLMNLYELERLDDYEFEIRSFKRELGKLSTSYQVETLMLNFFKQKKIYFGNREKIWDKFAPQIEAISKNRYEKQILKLFDFTAWIESKILGEDLTHVLKHRLLK